MLQRVRGAAARRAFSTSETATWPRTLRSHEWFGKQDKDGFIHRSWMRNQGLPDSVFDGRPVIGIANTFSELTPCNAHFRELAERVKRGVWESGGVPFEFPVLSTGETLMRPTAMLYRKCVGLGGSVIIVTRRVTLCASRHCPTPPPSASPASCQWTSRR